MNRKLKGFTIAELLISLLIISLVLSAAIPTITRKTAGNESIWQWSESANSAFFGVGEQQAAIIGNTYKPDGGVLTNIDEDTQNLLTDNKFVNSGDKLVLVKKEEGLSSSHISFYNVKGDTTSSVSYAGRLVLDSANIALGLGALANNVTNCTTASCTGAGNTAIGHFSLVSNEAGLFNTAIGSKTLSKNKASYNTAIGSYSGFSTEGDFAELNTGIGAFSLKNNQYSRENTAVGYMALYSTVGSASAASLTDALTNGGGNTAVGAGACMSVTGSKNVCLGHGASNAVISAANGNTTDDAVVAQAFKTRYNISAATNGFLYIGTDAVPLIAGRMTAYDDSNNANTKKVVALNTQDFDVNTPNSEYNVFNLHTKINTGGNSKIPGTYGNITFFPYQTANKKTEISLYTEDTNNEILTIDNAIYQNGNLNKYGQIWFNKGMLKFIIGKNATTNIENVAINPATVDGKFTTMILDNGRLTMNDTGQTVLSNGNGGTGLGNAFINLNTDNSIDIGHSARIKRATNTATDNEITLNGTNIKLMSSGASAALNVQLTSNFNEPATFNKNVKFEEHSNVTSKNDIVISGLKDTFIQIPGAAAPKDDGIRENLIAVWFAINKLAMNIIAYHPSDARLKNISGDNTAGLKEINALQVKNYTYKNDKEKTPHVGVIAQQLQKVFPNSVKKGDDGYLVIRTEEIFYAMVNSIKELFVKLQDLTAKVTGLESRINKLEQENAQLKKQNAEFEKRLKKLEAKL